MTTLLEVKNLKKYFNVGGGVLHAVDNVSFKAEKGTTVGVVGESGCGKSTLGRTLIHLEEATSGQILFHGEDITNIKGKRLKSFREKVQMIFQDPYSSLNPRMTTEETIIEPLKRTGRYKKAEMNNELKKLMNTTGIAERFRQAYPHELDGGNRQRVGIARALALNPDFIICDEPVSALDVSIQAQILNLLMDIQEERGVTLMFVTHDLSVVRHISRTIVVMYLGQMVEFGNTVDIFKKQYHPYTKALISAVPSVDIHKPSDRVILKGELTSPINPKSECRFKSRCRYACEKCSQEQHLVEVGAGHYVACCRATEING